MFNSLVVITLLTTLVLFVLVAGGVFYQIGREARRQTSTPGAWLTQTTWALVPIAIVAGLLLLALSARPAPAPGPAPARVPYPQRGATS